MLPIISYSKKKSYNWKIKIRERDAVSTDAIQCATISQIDSMHYWGV